MDSGDAGGTYPSRPMPSKSPGGSRESLGLCRQSYAAVAVVVGVGMCSATIWMRERGNQDEN